MSADDGCCAYCGADGPLTLEHAWPQWTDDHVPGDGRWRYNRQLHERDAQRWETATIQIKVRDVCGRCNSGWMNGIEAAARSSLIPLIDGSALLDRPTLTDADQRLLAVWSTKTTHMLDRALGTPRVPETHLREFFNAGRAHTPHATSAIWIAALAPTEPGYKLHRGSLSVHRPDEQPGTVNGYVITFAIGLLAVSVFGHMTGRRTEIRRPPDAAEIAIWPPGAGDHSWPPGERALNDEGFREFAAAMERPQTVVLR